MAEILKQRLVTMSKVPIEKNGELLQSSGTRDTYPTDHPKMKMLETIHPTTICKEMSESNSDKKSKEQTSKKSYVSLIPKMNQNFEKVVEQNPRILDLREKLNEITKNQNRNVDKKTKGLINDITQQLVDDKGVDDSGPYSLLFDLQTDPSTSHKESGGIGALGSEKNIGNARQNLNKSTSCLNKNADRHPNVLDFDEKPMREFEYSCENDYNFPAKKTFNTHSRSDLCLQLKSHNPARNFESNLSPNENSLSRTNEENSLDDSLGILTPDQMDDMCYLDNTFSPTVEGLPSFYNNNDCKISPDNGDTPSTEKTDSNSAASTIQNEGFDSLDSKKPKSESYLPTITATDNNVHPNLITVIEESSTQNVCHDTSDVFKSNNLDNEDATLIKENVGTSIDEEFMPSVHSSILEPASSIADNTVNLEIPLDCKHDNRIVVNRVEQTPSPEDLPLDHSDLNGEISTYSQFSASTLHESQTYSDSKTDYTKSMETSKVSNSFITSITSITSLDGYQGDGEMSRPVSRGADHSISHREDVIEMDWQNVPVTRRTDPMTDSDFFTESDADGLDDNAMQRGDRRAQVIDGALYGGKNGNGNPPLIVNRNDDSCMESSGVYTDFENHRSSPVFLNVIDDLSPEGSTPSTRSECSQKNGNTTKFDEGVIPLDSNDKNSEQPQVVGAETPRNSSKRNSLNSEKGISVAEKSKEEKRSFTLKKYKMPKRDVPSKLKSMLATSVQNGSNKNILKKPDRRENLSKKNSLDLKTDYKTKSFKDIKSKVDSSLSLQRSQTACSVNRMLSSKSSNTNAKPKSRHMRMRMDLGSAAGSGKSSLHSSQSDISAISTPLPKHATSRFPLLRNAKKRDSVPPPTANSRPPATPPQTPPSIKAKKNGVVQKLASSPASVRVRNTAVAPPPSPRKPTPLRVPAQRPNTLPTNNKDTPKVAAAAVGPRGKRVQTPQPTRTPPPALLTAPQPVVPLEQTVALAHAAKGVEALGVLVQYLVFRLDALNGNSWKLEADRWRSMAAAERSSAARADRDRQQRAQKDLDTIAECLSKISELEMEVSSKEEANACLQAAHIEEVTALANDIKGLKDTIESLKHEVAESRARLYAHNEIERTLRAQLEAVRAELEHANDCAAAQATLQVNGTDVQVEPLLPCDKSCEMCDAACDPVCCEAEDCEIRLNEELSTDSTSGGT
ncbi:uncharacterized protein LOC113226795 isoform X2 [Hyposmocoma kahamanoa]|uniref:uncharacterized protein LOC113226795 isoform X2 n=1 Tax=Hyposmocoma kahamanoa TaxID=1477025 RepID=UPI000E6D6846|nr:uncharacterized protein LOC113226795 isoform X2 [Hyposmocoma kahamanoa]